MSAYLVDRACIDGIVLVHTRRSGHAPHDAIDGPSNDELGRKLLRENMLSLAGRYGDPIDEETLATYRYAPGAKLQSASAVALIKNIHCYRYQACEHGGWEESWANQLCDALLNYLIHELPGYSDAPWGFTDDTP